MKKIKNKLHVMISAFITSLMGLFGVSCVFPGPVMYGPAIPEDFLEIEGEVTNEQNEPLKSMQVTISTTQTGKLDSLYTNQEGEFGGAYGFPEHLNDTLQVIVKDTADNYLADTVQIAFTDLKVESEDDWTTHYEADLNIQLKKK